MCAAKSDLCSAKKRFLFLLLDLLERVMKPLKQIEVFHLLCFSAQPLTWFSSDLGIDGAISAGNFKQSAGDRNRVEIGLSFRPPWLHGLAEPIPWNRFLGFFKSLKFQYQDLVWVF